MYLSDYIEERILVAEAKQEEANRKANDENILPLDELKQIYTAYYWMGVKHELARMRTKLANGDIVMITPAVAG